ncbi:MAG: hypothetical protein Kow0037_32400 [Calditrichia bacterium]
MKKYFKDLLDYIREEGEDLDREQWFAVYGFVKAMYIMGYLDDEELNALSKLIPLSRDDRNKVLI